MSDFLRPHGLARQASHMVFSRREYWSGLPCLPPGDFPYPRIEPTSPALQVDSLPLSHLRSSPKYIYMYIYTQVHTYT